MGCRRKWMKKNEMGVKGKEVGYMGGKWDEGEGSW